jgi:DNA-binding PadR family transcriptional regulator
MNDLILLAALLDCPQHGWALKKLAGFLSGPGDMHNNLVYPLLKKFVAQGWVRRRSEPGQRGQIRSVYSLTSRGNQELHRRLKQFGEKEASSSSEFRVRVGLFSILDAQTRSQILSERDRWLAGRENRFRSVQSGLATMNASEWGERVVRFLLKEIRLERKWIRALGRESTALTPDRKSERR